MRTLTTFEFYRDVFQGALIPVENFGGPVQRASAEINRLTLGRVLHLDPVPDAVQMAVCAASEVIYRRTGEDGSELPAIQRERLEQHDIQYVTMQHTPIRDEIFSEVSLYLWDTDLLSAAVPFFER